jgi:hypothetical protein
MEETFSVKNLIICDDARIEVSGKAILIGVYTGSIKIGIIPVVLPTFSVFVEVKVLKLSYDRTVFFIRTPNKQEVGRTEGPAKFDNIEYNGSLIYRVAPIAFEVTGDYEVWVEWIPLLERLGLSLLFTER